MVSTGELVFKLSNVRMPEGKKGSNRVRLAFARSLGWLTGRLPRDA